ncbi:MAG TPA: SagB/ThcOx family dehydrogenase [Vicinamibacterales bacterium]|nr:SagB/ThcOx family dehydrogenase [Vicinamibacterales bacterium]
MTISPVQSYHDGTKHHFHRFARSLGYLDWASQPNPFRSFSGAPLFDLPPDPAAPEVTLPVGPILRYALGLTAWKAFGSARWSLRANPSSGNLHPTEAYVVAGPAPGLAVTAGVYHYRPDHHALEQRCAIDAVVPPDTLLVALTSIHWREAWKYGERAFRYCQHDIGHAIAAVRLAASLAGWHARLLPDWSDDAIAAVTGIDREQDFVDAEREEPACMLLVSRPPGAIVSQDALVDAVRRGRWAGTASRLSEEHVQWTFIDEVAVATRLPTSRARVTVDHPTIHPATSAAHGAHPVAPIYPPGLLLQRRSAVALDGRSSMASDRFLELLSRTMPDASAPWGTLWWSPRIHLALFVHRVDGLAPGLYLLTRSEGSGERLKAALGREFLNESVTGALPLTRLSRGDCRAIAQRVSCDQDIAADGFFSLGMIADFDASLAEFGPSFYRRLFWESGFVGQLLYLEAEAAGARGTGIGCFYDDPVHDVLGLTGHAFQSLYHFTVGAPVEDARLTSEPGYEWERRLTQAAEDSALG